MIVMSIQVDPNNQHMFTVEDNLMIEYRVADHQGMVRLFGTPEQWKNLFEAGLEAIQRTSHA